jgi:predicted ATPase/signal transduction histidine kinase
VEGDRNGVSSKLDYSASMKIYESSYATLFRGVRRAEGPPLVVKRLRSDYPGAIDVARLHHEHAILSSLSLAGVVRTYGLVSADGGLCLLLEDIGEQSVRSIVQSGRPTLGRFLELAAAMARVVDSIHQQSILHKDIKPDHFFIDAATGACKLIDFGIATRLSREAQPAITSAPIEGTFAYISPEQTGRMNRVVDQRSDLYSLGVTLYELLTGVVPFSGIDPLALAHSHIARTAVPPHELVPDVPPAISAIVMKLLAKTAEDRYQGAAGLVADLEFCSAELAASGHVEPFPLGRHDLNGVLHIPQRLYGRSDEASALLAAFERVRAGAAELLLIRGPSGAGKSAVVNELHKLLVLRGHFVAGKFDQLNRAVPYAPLSAACRDLMRAILAKPTAELAMWAERLRAALGPNGRVVADLVPELELVIGKQPPPLELGPSESQNRFELAFRRFVQVFASEGHPLLLFLDDLQWADAASLRLLHVLLTSPERGHLLVLGAYRDAEVGPAHVTALFLAELEAAGALVSSIALGPLEAGDVRQLFADALGCSEARVAPLADLALRKTLGNPFFLTQLMTALVDQGLLVFDAAAHIWTWQLDRIDAVMVTANVIDLLIDRIHRLRPATQEVLKVAACVGHRFDLETLATAMSGPAASVADALWELLSNGLLVPLDDRYQYVQSAGGERGGGPAVQLNASYRFLHDRVQQAAYALIDPGNRAAVHLQMGRLLVARSGEAPPDELLFDIVNHLNLGSALLDDPAERRLLARLDLRAGCRARDSAAHEAALGLLGHAVSLLGEGAWQTDYDIAHPARLAIAECQEALARFEDSLATLEELDRESRSADHRAAARTIKARILTKTNRLVESCAAAVEAAAMLGLELPTEPGALRAANRAAFGSLQQAMAGRESSLADLPAMTDTHALAVAHVLNTLIPSAFMSSPELFAQAALQAVSLSLRCGNPPDAAMFYPDYGFILRHITGDRATAYRMGRVGVTLAERPAHRGAASIAHFVFGMFLSHMQVHLSESLEHLRRAIRVGLENGDHLSVGYCAGMIPIVRFMAGDNLDEIAVEIEASAGLQKSIGDRINGALLSSLARTLGALGAICREPSGPGQGREAPAGPGVLADNSFLLSIHRAVSLVPPSILGDSSAALARSAEVDQVAQFLDGTILAVDHVFHRALARARSLRAAPADQRAALSLALDADEAILRDWAEAAPANNAHRSALVAAVRADASGATEQAMHGFDRAIALAREHGYWHHEALANELCGEFHLGQGRTKVARVYLVDAYHGYRGWGARTKLQELAARHPDLLVVASGAPEAHAPIAAVTEMTTSIGLDVASAMRMMQAIASELVLDKLIECLMRSVVENAGAQRGFLVVPRGDRLRLSAAVSVAPDLVRLGLTQDLETSQELATAVVHYVARSRNPVVLGDAAVEDRFNGDPYIVRAHPRSILCVPMVHQGRLSGVMYLENNAAPRVFDPARVELIQFLAAQAAIAIENATLYEELERRVAERTAALGAANQNLQVSLQQLGQAQRSLIDMSRQAGMADVATSILHNVGNVLNCVNVSAGVIKAVVEQSKAGNLARVAALFAEHRADLARFLGEDPRGKQLPDYLVKLADVLEGERATIVEELQSLGDNIDHIKVIVAMQQSTARMGGMQETVDIADLLDEAIRISVLSAGEGAKRVAIARDYAEVPTASMDRHKVLQIVLNLLSNARDAASEASDRTIRIHCGAVDGRIIVRVEDRGVGIPADHLDRIFNFGFTTKKKGHGFGLHSCANAAAELGGTLSCRSDGPGQGAVFTLQFPLIEAAAPPGAAVASS